MIALVKAAEMLGCGDAPHHVALLLRRQPDRAIDRAFVPETIVTRMPYENFEKVFNTFVRWARFGGLFAYDEASQRISLL